MMQSPEHGIGSSLVCCYSQKKDGSTGAAITATMGMMVIVFVALDTVALFIVVLFAIAKQLQIVLLSSHSNFTMHNVNHPNSFTEPVVKHLQRRMKGHAAATTALLLSCYQLK